MALNKFTIQKSFAISAGAGSGKTYTLSRRYINALLGFDYFREDYSTHKAYFEELKPAKVNEIVTITYTEAAALEMKGRIFDLVSKIINFDTLKNSDDGDLQSIALANQHSSEHLAYVKEILQKAYVESANSKISTIHAYCLDIIKSNADIARIDTKLDIVKEDEKKKELSKIIFDVLNEERNKELILDITEDVSIFFINGLIEKYVSNSKFRHDYDSFEKDSITIDVYKELIQELYPLPEISDDLLEEISVRKDVEICKEWFNEYVEKFKHFDAKVWGDFKVTAVTKSGKNKGNEYLTKISLGEKTNPFLTQFVKSVDAVVQYYTVIDEEKEILFFEKVTKIRNLLHQIKASYDRKLAELGKIDFDSIITKTLEIMPKVTTNFKYIMVDEFQDTNATQFSIVKHSMNANTNLFVVGDSKQSIYSFQGAEIEVFHDAVHDNTLFSSIEDMNQNYRSDRVVLENINAIFEKLLQKDTNLNLISQNYEAEPQNLYSSKKGGSFKYLIASQAYQEEVSELDTIANFISELYHKKQNDYLHISELINKQEKAVAIIFDSSTKMLALKLKLREKGITAKVSASENFYYTKEVNDIFNVLKALDILSKNPEHFSASQKYYLVGAMRSNIIKSSDDIVKKHMDSQTVDERLIHYTEILKTRTLSQTVKYIIDHSNIAGTYAHLDDIEQKMANLYKFLNLCREYEESSESNIYNFLALIENAIYFSEAKEDEAFFKSDNTKSIEICSIHSTKGLAYPLVLLANSEKGLYSQITSDALKHNNFTLSGEKKEIVGFKLNEYSPLSHRVLKQLDKFKHIAEKKRLLYVALTRAEHDVVISAQLKETSKGLISLREDSYLHMICQPLEIDKEELYGQNSTYCLSLAGEEVSIEDTKIEYVNFDLQEIEFNSKELKSATAKNETTTQNSAALLGTTTHKIIELYWDSFQENREAILDKMMIFEPIHRTAITENMNAFYKSEVYKQLQTGVQHHFELEFNVGEKIGFIDFIYYDEQRNGWVIVDFKTGKESHQKNEEYQKQLDFYQNVMESLNYEVVESRLLWLN